MRGAPDPCALCAALHSRERLEVVAADLVLRMARCPLHFVRRGIAPLAAHQAAADASHVTPTVDTDDVEMRAAPRRSGKTSGSKYESGRGSRRSGSSRRSAGVEDEKDGSEGALGCAVAVAKYKVLPPRATVVMPRCRRTHLTARKRCARLLCSPRRRCCRYALWTLQRRPR